MQLVEKISTSHVTGGHGLRPPWYRVEIARLSKINSAWFRSVPKEIYESALNLRDQHCRHCLLWSGSEGNFTVDNNLYNMIIRNRLCTGIYVNPDAGIPFPFYRAWHLEAGAPVGTFSKPDPRAHCTK